MEAHDWRLKINGQRLARLIWAGDRVFLARNKNITERWKAVKKLARETGYTIGESDNDKRVIFNGQNVESNHTTRRAHGQYFGAYGGQGDGRVEHGHIARSGEARLQQHAKVLHPHPNTAMETTSNATHTHTHRSDR